jgi:predicted dehydrogenase
MLQRGDLGRPVAVTASRVSGVLNPSWQERLLNPEYGLGGLEAHAHDIDLLINWLGEPQAIIAQGTFTDHGGCVRVHTLLQFPDGAQAGVEADYRVPLNFPLSMYLRIVGEEGAAVFTFRGALAARETARRHLTLFKNGQPPVEVQVPVTDAYVGMLNHFFDCVEQSKQPQWGNAEQGRQSVRTLLAILQSAKIQQSSMTR